MTHVDARRIGWVCSYTPLEIPVAAGLMPVKLEGGENLPKAQDPRIYHLMCPYVRAIFNKAVAKEFPSLEAVVFTNGCDALKRLFDLWKAYLPTESVFFLDVPKIQTDEAISYFEYRLRKWAQELECAMNRRINEEGLHEAIAQMNRLRTAYQEIVTIRKTYPPSMSFEDLNGLTRKVLGIWPVEGIGLLEEVREEISQSSSGTKEDNPRVFLMSTMVEQPKIIGMIEEAGLVIISEDNCMGGRHFHGLVSESEDPYRALAERYVRRWPCARMKGTAQRFEYIQKEIDENGVKGVIFLWLKYCDQSGFEIPLLKQYLGERGLPLLFLENDYTEGGLGQLKNRIEAFAEMLKGEF